MCCQAEWKREVVPEHKVRRVFLSLKLLLVSSKPRLTNGYASSHPLLFVRSFRGHALVSDTRQFDFVNTREFHTDDWFTRVR
jgi:hypothetical protein